MARGGTWETGEAGQEGWKGAARDARESEGCAKQAEAKQEGCSAARAARDTGDACSEARHRALIPDLPGVGSRVRDLRCDTQLRKERGEDTARLGTLPGVRDLVRVGTDHDSDRERGGQVERLCKHGADPSSSSSSLGTPGRGGESLTPLQLAAWGGHKRCVKALLREGAAIDSLDPSTPLPSPVIRRAPSPAVLRPTRCEDTQVGCQPCFCTCNVVIGTQKKLSSGEIFGLKHRGGGGGGV